MAGETPQNPAITVYGYPVCGYPDNSPLFENFFFFFAILFLYYFKAIGDIHPSKGTALAVNISYNEHKD